MNLPLQKARKISKQIIKISFDVRDVYIERYGNPEKWDHSTQQTFLLNADAEILYYLDKMGLNAHDKAYKSGITLWVLGIQKTITLDFLARYGDDMTLSIKELMLELMLKKIYDFIIKGITHAY
jgi:hypothetical protein